MFTRHTFTLTVSALVTAAITVSAATAPQPSRDARVDEIFKEFTAAGSPGCTAGVYEGGRVVHRGAYGMANLDHDVRLAPDSVFHVASVSKQFTAAAILLLAEDGKLSLDDEVRKFIPELPDFGTRITIRHLANHTSGIRDQWDLLGLAGWRYSRDLITDDDVLGLLSRQKALNFTPGERHLYSNSGYTLMAIIVSRVSGQSFREFTSSRIFQPLGMVNTHFRDRFSEIVKNQAYGYAAADGTFRLSVTNFDTAGATSLLTTADDLVKWHANFDQRSVGGERLQAGLLDRGVLNNGERIDYAFGISHGKYRGLPLVAHGGADAGYRAAFLRFPEQRFGVATLCNLASTNPTALSQRVADVFLADVLGPDTTAPEDSKEIPVPTADLARYEGLYWNKAQARGARFVLADDRLHAVQGTNRVPMKSLGEGKFVMTAGPRTQFRFERGPDGEILVKAGPELADVFVRSEPFAPTRAQLEDFAGVYRSEEIDTVFRMEVTEARLQLQHVKQGATALEPRVTDTFSAQMGVFQFTRNSTGRVSGFTLDGGRVRQMKFWKETAPLKPATSAGADDGGFGKSAVASANAEWRR